MEPIRFERTETNAEARERRLAFALRERERAAAAAKRRAASAEKREENIVARRAARRAKEEEQARATAEWEAKMKVETEARCEAEARRVQSRPRVCYVEGGALMHLVFEGGRGLVPDTPGVNVAPDGPNGIPGPGAHWAGQAHDHVLPRAPIGVIGRGPRENPKQALTDVESKGTPLGPGPSSPAVAACGVQADSTRCSAEAFSWGTLPRFRGELAGTDSPGVALYTGAALRDEALSTHGAPPAFSFGTGGMAATPLTDASRTTPGPAIFDLRPRPATTHAWPPSFSFGGCRLPKDPASRRKAQRRRNRSKEAMAAALAGHCGPGPAQLTIGGALQSPASRQAARSAGIVPLSRSPSMRPQPPMPAIRGAGAFAPSGRRQIKRYTRRFGGAAAPTPAPGDYDLSASGAIAPDKFSLVALRGTLGGARRGETARGELKSFQDLSRSAGTARSSAITAPTLVPTQRVE